MNYCIYLKKRKGKPFCKLLNKEITLSQCQECDKKEYKTKKVKKSFYNDKNYPYFKKTGTFLKKESNKHKKADKNRFSIIVNSLSKCCYPNCECTKGINLHEVFYGSYRHISIKYGLVIPLCPIHHDIGPLAIHNDRIFDLDMKFLAQEVFISKYSYELFMKEFKIDYIEKYKKK